MGVHEKRIYTLGLPTKGKWLGQFAGLRWGLAKKSG